MDQYFEFAKQFILETGDTAYSSWADALVVSTEDQGKNVSTNFDKEIEQNFYDAVTKEFPDHGFQGEENPTLTRKGKLTWFIDPIDGTKYFAKGIPVWCCVITLVENDKAVLALVYNPISKQLYSAQKGKGAFINSKRLEVNNDPNLTLKDIQISFDFPVSDKMKSIYNHDKKNSETPLLLDSWEQFQISKYGAQAKLNYEAYRVRDIGSGPFSLLWLAQGLFGGFISPAQHKSKIVDHLGPFLIAKEAGAVGELKYLSEGLYSLVVGSNETIVREMKKIFGY